MIETASSELSLTLQIENQLERISAEFLDEVLLRDKSLPTVPFESEWPSQCIQSVESVLSSEETATDMAYWKPVARDDAVDFSGLERALEVTFPPEFGVYFSHFWSGSIPVQWDDKHFELLQLWNAEDQQNLMHNLLGHVFETKRVRQTASLFFAVIDDERFLSCEIETGLILLEELGGRRPYEVAESLPALLKQISGCVIPSPR